MYHISEERLNWILDDIVFPRILESTVSQKDFLS